MSRRTKNKYPLFALAEAALAFLILFSILVALVLFYDFSNTNLGVLSFILALTVSVLIAKSIYDLAMEGRQTSSDFGLHKNSSSNTLLTEVYDRSVVAYLLLNKQGKVVSANKAAARLLGRSSTALNGASFFSCINTSRTEHLILLKEKFRNGVVVAEEEIEISHGAGSYWALLSISSLKKESGENLSLVTLLDITRQKEIDLAKSEFVSLASHQLRTPIAGMRWSAELLLMDGAESLTKQQQRYVGRLLLNVERMGDLVDDFLQVSRFDLGTRVIQPEVVKIHDLMDDILSEQIIVANGKNIKVKKEYDADVSEVVTDKQLLRMIITNIYSNALRYSRSGGVVSVAFRREKDNLVFSVEDTGIGIPLVDQPRIFTKVFRASNASREVPNGTGLGLYIVKKAVQVLRGRVTFVSTENVGTTFTVVIPIAL
ncbi:MAG: PAS domain-containing protein [Candidatus Nomurabacteria bacterium]|nr:MAG: PAS domain-containing protein [Candidatus Nomurabacteria bacterium]